MPTYMTRLSLLTVGLITLRLADSAPAATIYSNLQNIAIPLDFTGVYLDVDTGATGSAEFAGWDINPFFGGAGGDNSPAFQPARVSTGNTDTFLKLAAGATVDVSRFFSTGYGGSQTHLGTQFTDGQEGYLGFKFTTNSNTGPYYGWMRVVFTGNTAGASIKDWAYDDSGSAIVTGRVLQSAPSGNAQLVTLSPGASETFTLGSTITNTGGNTNSLLKTGTGTAILGTASTYSGGTTVSGGVLSLNSDTALGATTGGVTIDTGATLQAGGTITSNRVFTLGSGGGKIDTKGNSVTFGATSSVTGSTLTKIGTGNLTINGAQTYSVLNANAGTTNINTQLGTGNSTVNAAANVTFGASETLATLTIGSGATVALGGAAAAPAFAADLDPIASPAPDDVLSQSGNLASSPVPEPGGISLLFLGSLGLLNRRRKS